MHCLLFSYNSIPGSGGRPLGPYRIAHYLREHSWDAEVIEYSGHWDLESLKQLAKSRVTKDTKWFGISHIFSSWNDTMEEFLAWTKINYPWIKVISGANTIVGFNSQHIDYYIHGFGELALMELLKYLFSNGVSPRFDLLASANRKIISANKAYPSYPMKSLMVKYQDRDFILPGESLGVEFARGCKFECSYCNFPVLGVKGDYSRDAEDFREQVQDAYDRFGVESYYVADETFNDRTEKITKFADAVEKLTFRPWFSGFIRADLMVSRPLDRVELARMNFIAHFYGIESFNPTAGKAIGKGMNPDKLKQGLLDIKSYYDKHVPDLYLARMSFIIGLPGESRDDILQTRDWLIKHWKSHSWLFNLLTIPDNNSDIDRKSLLSGNFQKYGYSEMSLDEIKYYSSNVIYHSAVQKAAHKQIMWKNNHMNIFEAAQMENELHAIGDGNNEPNDWNMDNFQLTSPFIRHLSLRERRKLNNYQFRGMVKQNTAAFVKSYIDKKLSYEPR